MASIFPLYTPQSGSGGGGGSIYLDWQELANSAYATDSDNYLIYQFEATLGQQLFSYFKVPSTYQQGNQISLKILWYSADTSGNGLISSQSTLIRTSTDAISSTTNQRTSTNAAVTLSAGTANEPQPITLDLTSSTGTINSVAVSAGDLIMVRIYRGTDTATGVINFLPLAHEVTLS